MHIILCDKINSGKSTFVMELVRRRVDQGEDVSGWVTPPHLENGVKIGHDFVLIENGRLASPIPFTRHIFFEGSFPWRRFYFNLRAFEHAASLPPAAGLFVMDEIGPMELEDHSGFIGIARRALTESSSTLTVLRKGIERSFLSFAPKLDFKTMSLNEFRVRG